MAPAKLPHRAALLLGLGVPFAACAGPEASWTAEIPIPPSVPGTPDPGPKHHSGKADPLAYDAAARFPRRALLRRIWKVRYRPEGKVVSDNDEPTAVDHPFEVPVVEDLGGALRVVVESAGMRFLMVLDRVDFRRVPHVRVSVLPAPDARPSTDTGVWIGPGAFVDDKERRGERSGVEGVIDGLAVRGWVPTAALGEVFEPAPFAPIKGDGLVAGRASILASAGGPVIAAPGEPQARWREVELLPGAPAGWQSIRLVRPRIEVRGVVPTAASKRRAADDDLGEELMGTDEGDGYMTHVPTAILRRGASLYDPDDGKVAVAGARQAVTVFVFGPMKDAPEDRSVRVYFSPFGFLEARARAADLRMTRY